MLLTWIRDVYTKDDANELQLAIDEIASPLDGWGFASAGVYVFFDPVSLEILYIGLARDLSVRFAQHNGLAIMKPDSCKLRQIDDWFLGNRELGYAMYLQSPMDQVSTGRQSGTSSAEFYDEESGTFWEYGLDGHENVKLVEGSLIRAYKDQHGVLPSWNKIEGGRDGADKTSSGTYALLRLASGAADSLLLARASIREIGESATLTVYETELHVARWHAVKVFGKSDLDTPRILKAMDDLAS